MFENILGHSDIKKSLNQNLQSGTISHAYTFYGKEGIGKLKIALEFAKNLLNNENINNCIDFKLITKLEDKQNILVEQIRDEIISDVYIAPAVGKYKVYIIDDADKMNLAAQNTLLKTLEEPPESIVIILVTSNIDALLPTILSRTNNIFFDNLTIEQMKQYAKENNILVDTAMLEFADGSIKTLLDITNEQENKKYTNLDSVIKAIKDKDNLQLIMLLQEVDLKDRTTVEYFEFLLLKEGKYAKIELIEQTKKAILANASEEMQKSKLAIELLK